MCTAVIIDANVFGDIDKPEFDVLHSWLHGGHGFLAFTDHGRYAQELDRNNRMLMLLGAYRQAQRIKHVPANMVREVEYALDASAMISNDKHVLALAMVSGATILCSRDERLKIDFLNRELLPKVGRRKRAVYPLDQQRKERRQFLDGRKCRAR